MTLVVRLISMLRKGNALFCIALFISLASFTADIVDLREELHFRPSPYSSLDSSITAGMANDSVVITEPAPVCGAVHQKSSVKICFFHFFPLGFRAPPAWS